MRNERFWKIVAVAAVVGLFYLGSSVRAPGAEQQAMPWESVARGLVVDPTYSPWGGKPVAVTCSPDGRTLYFWDRANNGAVAIRVEAGAMEDPNGGVGWVMDRGPKVAAPGSGKRQIPVTTKQR